MANNNYGAWQRLPVIRSECGDMCTVKELRLEAIEATKQRIRNKLESGRKVGTCPQENPPSGAVTALEQSTHAAVLSL